MLAVGPGICRSPSAAPAAGGRGIPDPQLVYSVGVSSVPAGGVEEVVKLAVQFVTALLPFDGGAPWSLIVKRTSSGSSPVSGSGEFSDPSPDRSSGSIWIANKKMEVVVWIITVKTMAQGAGLSGPLSGDFPSAEGLLPNPSQKRSSGGGAPPARPGRRRHRDLEGPVCNFIFVLDLSVRMVI